jgi:hypothetical protein
MLLLILLFPWLRREHLRRVKGARISGYCQGYYRGSAAAMGLVDRHWADSDDDECSQLDGCISATHIARQRQAGRTGLQ